MLASDTFIDWLDLKQDHLKTFHCGNAPTTAQTFSKAHESADASYLAALEGKNKFQPFDLYHSGVYARGQEIVEQAEGGNVYYLLTGKAEDPKNAGSVSSEVFTKAVIRPASPSRVTGALSI